MEKLKSEKENEEKEKVDNFFINATRSVDLDQPNISLNQYKADLKKSLLSINPEAEKLMNITKKIMTPSGNFLIIKNAYNNFYYINLNKKIVFLCLLYIGNLYFDLFMKNIFSNSYYSYLIRNKNSLNSC